MVNEKALFFFHEHPAALPLYEALEEQILSQIEGVSIKVQKTQITFASRYGFAFISFVPVRPAKLRPETWLTVTFGLEHRVQSPRIDAASEPYPNRWTHHVMVASAEEIDEELMDWLKEAAAFSAQKGRRRRS